jgi:hypothetical protein
VSAYQHDIELELVVRHSKRTTPKKRAARKRTNSNSVEVNENAVNARENPHRKQSQRETLESHEMVRPRAAIQSGNFQGLSDIESADSESVEELLEEGNAFEANVVAGVEHADDDQRKEVHTHQVPEDDVREEYLDRDL